MPDFETASLVAEVAHRKTLPAWITDKLEQAERHVTSKSKLRVLILHSSGNRHEEDLVVMRLEALRKLLREDSDPTQEA